MLVLLVMALVTATVLPNLFPSASAGLTDEGRRLRQVLHLALEEAQLRGVPVRWTAYANRYVFEIPDGAGEWQALREKPFGPDSLPEKIRIASVQLQDGLPHTDTHGLVEIKNMALHWHGTVKKTESPGFVRQDMEVTAGNEPPVTLFLYRTAP